MGGNQLKRGEFVIGDKQLSLDAWKILLLEVSARRFMQVDEAFDVTSLSGKEQGELIDRIVFEHLCMVEDVAE